MSQREVVQCPACGAHYGVTVAFPYGTEEGGPSPRKTVERSDGCPDRFNADHRDVTDDEITALVNRG